jgi:competence protein ComFA
LEVNFVSHHFCWKGYVYLVWNEEQAALGLTPWPLLDLAYFSRHAGYDRLLCLTPELPLGQAFYLASSLARQDLIRPLTFKPGDAVGLTGSWPLVEPVKALLNKKLKTKMNLLVDYLQDKAGKILREEGIGPEWQKVTADEAKEVELPGGEELESLIALLEGRLLFPKEILQAVSDNYQDGWPPFQLKVLLQLAYLKGCCHLYPGVAYLGKGVYRCVRCGSVSKLEAISCLDCNENCVCCEECQAMGESRFCRPLYGFPDFGKGWVSDAEAITQPEVRPQLTFNLTKAQQDASRELEEFVIGSPKNEALVWAVCGAGKTEVSFAAIARMLANGGKVLFAIPRRDVVLELISRLEQAFPGVELAALYGGSQGKYIPARLVLATTHQAIRFYRLFDLVVLDEVDAYPYSDSDMLRYAIHRAKKEEGKIVYMTATPNKELYRQGKSGKIGLIHIPARHHGYPVPVPELLIGDYCKLQEDGEVKFSREILSFIHQTIEGDLAQLFIFAPSIFLTEQVGKSLRRRVKLPPFNDFAGDWVAYSHAKDLKREDKRRRFAEGEYPILVSTTIMERGITVAKANVLVLFANYQQVFDEGTLVQMAGRSGRSSIYPGGKVLFVGDKVSPAMEEAIARIREQNQEAALRGYLRESPRVAKKGWGL